MQPVTTQFRRTISGNGNPLKTHDLWPTARRGFTLVELLISMIVTAIIGAALVRMVLSQARFMDQQEAWREARSVSRGGINRLLSDLRAVEARGRRWTEGSGGRRPGFHRPGTLRLRHPLRHCRRNVYTVSLLPVDATMFAEPGYTGFAIRNKTGVYSYNTSSGHRLAGTTALCLNGVYDSIHTVPAAERLPRGTGGESDRSAAP